jgi:hypothetical protein
MALTVTAMRLPSGQAKARPLMVQFRFPHRVIFIGYARPAVKPTASLQSMAGKARSEWAPLHARGPGHDPPVTRFALNAGEWR